MREPAQEKREAPLAPKGVYWAYAGLIRSVSVKNSTSESSVFRVFVCELSHSVQGSLVDDRVWVQDENVFATACPNCNIIPFSKPEVGPVFEYADLWELCADKLYRSVRRAVVGNDDFKIDRVRRCVDR